MLYGLAAGLAEALTAMHVAGVIHRDLKPGNVLLTQSGPKVIDFGIAQALDSTTVTRTGMTVGSPGFMAPEQVAGQAGQPADVFAWGLTVAYAASGKSPFGTGPTDAVLYRIMHEDPDIAAMPSDLRPLVAVALAKNPQERPAAPDLFGQLASAAGQVPPTWPRRRCCLARGCCPRGTRRPPVAAKPRRWRYLVPVSAAVLVAAVAGGGAALLAKAPPQARASATDSLRSSAIRPSPSAASSAPSTLAASPPAAALAPGTVRSGAQDCTFNSDDGEQLASVAVTHTVCKDWPAALASNGEYWWPVDYSAPDTVLADGATEVCALSADGMTMTVYDLTTNAPQQTPAGIAQGICQREEQNGWVPS